MCVSSLSVALPPVMSAVLVMLRDSSRDSDMIAAKTFLWKRFNTIQCTMILKLWSRGVERTVLRTYERHLDGPSADPCCAGRDRSIATPPL